MSPGQERPPAGTGLEGKVAVVTGGGSRGPGVGNGRAAAVLLAADGARVLVVDVDGDAAEETVAMVAEEGGEAAPFRTDVATAEGAAAAVAEAVRRWGRLDVLDNNVGIGSRGSVVDETEEAWERVLRVNVLSMVLCAKHAVPVMAAGGGGAVVNISSISALRPRGLTAYSTSKGAVIALTRAMAVDHAPQGVRVNCVAPGPAYTPMVAGALTPEARERRRRSSPLGVEGTGWDVGEAVRFLASDRARWITGQVLVVDGGVTLASPERATGEG